MKFKKIFSLKLFFFLFISFKLFAQDDSLDQIQFEEQPVKDEKPAYFSIGVGYTGSFFFLNYDELNKILKSADPLKNFGLDDFKSYMYCSGIEGYTSSFFIKNLRVGFYGSSGSMKKEVNLTVGTTPVKRSVEYSVQMMGFAIDYSYVPFKSFAISPGVNLGWGSLIMDSYQAKSQLDWTTDITPGADNINYFNRAQAGFLYLHPNLNFEFAFTTFTMIRASIGYSASFMGALSSQDWKYNNNATLNNVPKGMNASGLTIQFGIFVGLFNY